MTGYGKSEVIVNNSTISIEIKSLNSKALDVSVKVPSVYKQEELAVRKLLTKKLSRGKVEVSVWVDQTKDSSEHVINAPAIKEYYKQILDLKNDLDIGDDSEIISSLIKLPSAIIKNTKKLDEESWENVYVGIEKALDNLILFRQKEGKELENDIVKKLNNISDYLEKIPDLANKKIDVLKEKIKEKILTLNLDNLYDNSRLEQELLYYLEKQDINEELVRLESHIKYFKDTVSLKEPKGKKLGFISQEIGREINTIGSKVGELNIQKIVVEMKNELEKIKEQLLNIV